MGIKKAYQEVFDFLTANADKKVKTILDDVEAMFSARSAGGVATTIHRDEEGNISLVRCSYYKLWMPLSHVIFGSKAGSASGLNPMCKEGVSNWTKSQRDFRKAKEGLLEQVMSGDLEPSELRPMLEELEATRVTIVPRADSIGWATVEEALAITDDQLNEMAESAVVEEPAEEVAETEEVVADGEVNLTE